MKRIIRYMALGLLASLGPALTSCSTPAPRQVSRPVVYKIKPTVTIRNQSSRSLGVSLTGPESRFVYIPSYSSRTVNLKSGAYKYIAVSKNARSLSGYKYFAPNKKYDWKFKRN